MSEDFGQMLEAAGLKTIRNGEIVEGTVIDVKKEEVILDIGYKSDGVIVRGEYTTDNSVTDLREVIEVGSQMEAKVIKVNDGEGQVALSYRRLAQERNSALLEKAFEEQEVLTATVGKVLDGGLSVTVDETRVFIPASLVSDTFVKDLHEYDGKEISFIITEFNPRKRRIIGDRRALIIKDKEEKLKELLETLKVGDVIEGKVKNVTTFGAFIDLGGADGLLHISEMSWGRVDNPKKLFKSGDDVRVFVKDIKENKIALSMKFPEENPWNDAANKFAPGTVLTGKVARMTDFGAFVSLAPGVDALLHVSQISREHVDKPSDVLSVGQEVEVKIVDFNEENHKISLSMKALQAPAKKQEDADVADVNIEEVGQALAEEEVVEEAPAEDSEA
ncbi:MAG: 30S ribosomal protein S1 [Eubacterium sp.]|nr:30S ribosomal protein S1 [Eubacterium sp.]